MHICIRHFQRLIWSPRWKPFKVHPAQLTLLQQQQRAYKKQKLLLQVLLGLCMSDSCLTELTNNFLELSDSTMFHSECSPLAFSSTWFVVLLSSYHWWSSRWPWEYCGSATDGSWTGDWWRRNCSRLWRGATNSWLVPSLPYHDVMLSTCSALWSFVFALCFQMGISLLSQSPPLMNLSMPLFWRLRRAL